MLWKKKQLRFGVWVVSSFCIPNASSMLFSTYDSILKDQSSIKRSCFTGYIGYKNYRCYLFYSISKTKVNFRLEMSFKTYNFCLYLITTYQVKNIWINELSYPLAPVGKKNQFLECFFLLPLYQKSWEN